MDMVKHAHKDMEILSLLRSNSSRSLTSLCKETEIPLSTLHARMRQKIGKMIHRYTVLLDQDTLAMHVGVFILAKVPQTEEVPQFLLSHPSTNGAWKVHGQQNIVIEAMFPDLRAVDEFLDELLTFGATNLSVLYTTAQICREHLLMQNRQL